MKYKYVIIRSARKSVAISISVDNQITVRAPWSMHTEQIAEFVDSKERWIEKVVRGNSLKFSRNVDIIDYKSILVDGKPLPLFIGDKNGIFSDCVHLKSLRDVEKTYEAHFYGRLSDEVKTLAEKTRTTPASVSVKSYKGRWGCCDAKNNLIFNFLLFMLPRELQAYVIVHELCHTICHNHSHAFWKLVGECLPDYKALRDRMSLYDFLTTLY